MIWILSNSVMTTTASAKQIEHTHLCLSTLVFDLNGWLCDICVPSA